MLLLTRHTNAWFAAAFVFALESLTAYLYFHLIWRTLYFHLICILLCLVWLEWINFSLVVKEFCQAALCCSFVFFVAISLYAPWLFSRCHWLLAQHFWPLVKLASDISNPLQVSAVLLWIWTRGSVTICLRCRDKILIHKFSPYSQITLCIVICIMCVHLYT